MLKNIFKSKLANSKIIVYFFFISLNFSKMYSFLLLNIILLLNKVKNFFAIFNIKIYVVIQHFFIFSLLTYILNILLTSKAFCYLWDSHFSYNINSNV